jgi:hypothetical protein
LPAIYDKGKPGLADQYLLGRATDWIGLEEGPALGVGSASL